MTINRNKYVIASKTFPLMFYDKHGNEFDDFEEPMMSERELAESVLNIFDEPNQFQVLEIKVRYEI